MAYAGYILNCLIITNDMTKIGICFNFSFQGASNTDTDKFSLLANKFSPRGEFCSLSILNEIAVI